METLARMVDPDVPSSVFSLPVGQLVLQALDTREDLTSVQEASVGRLIRAAVPILSNSQPGAIEGVVVVDTYISDSLCEQNGRDCQTVYRLSTN